MVGEKKATSLLNKPVYINHSALTVLAVLAVLTAGRVGVSLGVAADVGDSVAVFCRCEASCPMLVDGCIEAVEPVAALVVAVISETASGLISGDVAAATDAKPSPWFPLTKHKSFNSPSR